MSILSLKDYGFKYEKGEEILKDISFSVDEGEIVLVGGDSGSGKSTLLNSLNGLIPQFIEGKIRGSREILFRDMSEMKIYEISRHIGSVFQDPRSQFFTLDALSELVFPMENFALTRKTMDKRLESLINTFELKKFLKTNIYDLSSGQRQLLALASAMVLGPSILVLDEPSSNLDYRNAMKLRQVLKKLKQDGISVIISEHRYFYLEGLIDKVIYLEDGKMKFYKSEQSFKSSNYDTRNFNIFKSDYPMNPKKQLGEIIAVLEDICFKDIIKNLSLKLRIGEITCLIGKNGTGKTTLARILTGSLKLDSGSISVKDQPYYTSQDPNYQLFGPSVKEELLIGNPNLEDNKIDEILLTLGLEDKRQSHPFELSGGQKQRLQLAVATLSKASLLILDEPTSGLDLRSIENVCKIIMELSTDKAILVISHDYELIRRLANRIIYMEEGQIKSDFVFNEKNIEKLNNIFKKMED